MREVLVVSLVLALSSLGFLGAALAGQFAPAADVRPDVRDDEPRATTLRGAAGSFALSVATLEPIGEIHVTRTYHAQAQIESLNATAANLASTAPMSIRWSVGDEAETSVQFYGQILRVNVEAKPRFVPLAAREIAEPVIEEAFYDEVPEPGAYLFLVHTVQTFGFAEPSFEPLAPVQGPERPDAPAANTEWSAVLVVVTPDRTVAVYALGSMAAVATAPGASTSGAVRAQSRGHAKGGIDILGTPWLMVALFAIVLVAAGAWSLRLGAPLAAGAFFSRFDRDDVLQNDRRSRLYECVRSEPGIGFGRLCTIVGLENGAAQHHLQLLVQHGLIRRVRDGRLTRFFPTGGPRIEFTIGVTPARQRVLTLLRAEAGLSASQVAARIGQRVQTAWLHLESLRNAGLVTREKHGRATSWRVAVN